MSHQLSFSDALDAIIHSGNTAKSYASDVKRTSTENSLQYKNNIDIQKPI